MREREAERIVAGARWDTGWRAVRGETTNMQYCSLLATRQRLSDTRVSDEHARRLHVYRNWLKILERSPGAGTFYTHVTRHMTKYHTGLVIAVLIILFFVSLYF